MEMVVVGEEMGEGGEEERRGRGTRRRSRRR